jgi:hypothetical protein
VVSHAYSYLARGPSCKAYPGFRLGDADTTGKVLVKHLVCACTGLPRQDLERIFEYGKYTPQRAMDLLATMQPTSKFGEVFQYSNVLAAAGGYVAGHVLYPDKEFGAAYDEAMKKLVFDPLGMKTATFDSARVLKGNHAGAHAFDVDGRPAPGKMGMSRASIPLRPESSRAPWRRARTTTARLRSSRSTPVWTVSSWWSASAAASACSSCATGSTSTYIRTRTPCCRRADRRRCAGEHAPAALVQSTRRRGLPCRVELIDLLVRRAGREGGVERGDHLGAIRALEHLERPLPRLYHLALRRRQGQPGRLVREGVAHRPLALVHEEHARPRHDRHQLRAVRGTPPSALAAPRPARRR